LNASEPFLNEAAIDRRSTWDQKHVVLEVSVLEQQPSYWAHVLSPGVGQRPLKDATMKNMGRTMSAKAIAALAKFSANLVFMLSPGVFRPCKNIITG